MFILYGFAVAIIIGAYLQTCVFAPRTYNSNYYRSPSNRRSY